jgi:hypothetical protein
MFGGERNGYGSMRLGSPVVSVKSMARSWMLSIRLFTSSSRYLSIPMVCRVWAESFCAVTETDFHRCNRH